MELAADLGGALVLALVVLVVLAAAAGNVALAWPGRWRELGRGLVARGTALDLATTVAVLAVAVAIVAVTGSAVLIGDVDVEFLVINEEQTVPAYFGAALLLVAGALALGIGTTPAAIPVWPWLLLGIVLIALGLDEAAEIHERLESRTDLPAAIVLAPVALAGLVAFIGAAPRLRAAAPALALFVAGGIAWAVAQGLDPIHSVDWKSSIEETLELSGSALFLLALQLVARDLSRR